MTWNDRYSMTISNFFIVKLNFRLSTNQPKFYFDVPNVDGGLIKTV